MRIQMSKETTLRSSLSAFFLLVLLTNTCVVTLAARAAFHGQPWSAMGQDTSMGLRWLILAVAGLGVLGADRLIHGIFLEGGVSPVDTTWSDIMFMSHLLLTLLGFLFMSDSSWMAFGFFFALLFVFTVVILRRLLEDTRRWLIWLIGTVVLMGLTVVVTSNLFGS